MNICIAGKNNIAVDVASFVLKHYPMATIYAVPNRDDDGIDGWQRSFLRYAQNENRIIVATLEQMYEVDDLLFLSTEFDRIVKPGLFLSNRLYNIHFSLLPAYKGCYTSVMPILNGEDYCGVTLHCMDAGIDTGDIIAQRKFRLTSIETSYSLYLKLIKYGTELVICNFDKLLNNTFKVTPQSSARASYYSRKVIDYSNLLIDLNRTAAQVDAQIRAFYFPVYQLPKVYDYEIERAHITKIRSTLRPGTIIKDTVQWFLIATIDYDVKLYKAHKKNVRAR